MIGVAALSLVPALAVYVAAWFGWIAFPTGSGGVGFWFGVAGAAVILFEMLLSLRKRVWRGRHHVFGIPLGRARKWMALHIWLGLAAIPIAIIHSGFKLHRTRQPERLDDAHVPRRLGKRRLGSSQLQQILPRRIFDQVSDETIAAEIETVLERDVADAEQMLRKLSDDTVLTGQAGAHVTLSAPAAARLQRLFDDEVKPYLLEGRQHRTPLASVSGSAALFSQLHRELPEHAYEAARRLERLCDVRRQAGGPASARLDGLLHGWLLIHIPLAVALVLLLAWHVVTALKLW